MTFSTLDGLKKFRRSLTTAIREFERAQALARLQAPQKSVEKP